MPCSANTVVAERRRAARVSAFFSARVRRVAAALTRPG